MNRTLCIACVAAIAAVGCGGSTDHPLPKETSGAVAIDADQAYSVVQSADPSCPADQWPCGFVRRWSRTSGASSTLADVGGLGPAIAVDDAFVYFTSTLGQIYAEGAPEDDSRLATTLLRVAKSGGPPATLATLPHQRVPWLVVRGGRVIFTTTVAGESGDPQLESVPVDGGDVTPMAKLAGSSVTALAADDATVYWAERDTSNASDTFVVRSIGLAPDAQATDFARGAGWIRDMALDGSALYVTNDGGSLMSYARAGAAPSARVIASGLDSVRAVAVDDQRVVFVVWGTASPDPSAPRGEVRAVPKSGGAATTLVGSYDVASLSADSAGVCMTALFEGQVTCLTTP